MALLLQSVEGLYSGVVGTLVPFVFVLTLIVFVHEMGHFLVARRVGVSVAAFSIGFGPELFGRTDRYGTRWKLSAIPLGGYVKFVDDADSASAGAVPDATALAGAFRNRPLAARAAVVAAGPLANFLLAIVVFSFQFSVYGKVQIPPRVGEVMAASAAEAAGLKPGDVITGIDGEPIVDFTDIQRIVRLATGETLHIRIHRGDRDLTLDAVPLRHAMADPLGNVENIGMLGIRPADDAITVVRRPPLQAVHEAVAETWSVVSTSLTYLGRMVTGRESTDQLSGTIRVARVSGQVATQGILALINLAAVLSISIGMINLFPIPVLDGGHLIYFLAEALLGRPLPERVQQAGMRVGLALVMALMLFATWNDISHLIAS